MTKVRESNFELLRLVVMAMIVIHHGIVRGIGVMSMVQDCNYQSISELCKWGGVNCFVIIAVNVFILISGYFSIKLKLSKVLSIIFQTFFYTFLLITIPFLIYKYYLDAVVSLFIFSHSYYWFIPDYIFLMLFSPMLNLFHEHLTKRQNLWFCIFLLLTSCYLGFVWKNEINEGGYCLYQFITMYYIGRTIRVYEISIPSWKCIIGYFMFVVLNIILFVFLIKIDAFQQAWQITNYNNPLIVFAAISFFLLFKNIKLKSKLINTLAKSTLAIYLISSSKLEDFYFNFVANQWNTNGDFAAVVSLIAFVIIFFVIAFLVDPIQRKINQKVINRICAKVS